MFNELRDFEENDNRDFELELDDDELELDFFNREDLDDDDFSC
jgi:hypothetical protein